MNKESGCARVLRVLGDGEWHTSAELYRSTGCIVHCRISDLRRYGHIIDKRHVGGRGAESVEYRLVSSDAAATVKTGGKR